MNILATTLLVVSALAIPSCGGSVDESGAVSQEREALTTVEAHPNFVFVLGELNVASHTNWVWIGTYTLDPATKQIHSARWHWYQTARVSRQNTGLDSCLPHYTCPVRAAGGFQGAPSLLSGKYSVSGNVLSILWNDGHTQKWTIQQTTSTSAAGGKIVRLAAVTTDDFGANYGWGYGSKASLAAATRLSDLVESSQYEIIYHYTYRIWKTNNQPTAHIDQATNGTFRLGPTSGWQRCPNTTTSRCLSQVTTQKACGVHPQWNLSIVDLASADRRNAREYWCQENATARGETCYTGNSHVDPFLQVLDDDGHFRGWVGVEASLGQGSAGNWSDDQIGVLDISDSRLTFQ
jgi:hypothetical protein